MPLSGGGCGWYIRQWGSANSFVNIFQHYTAGSKDTCGYCTGMVRMHQTTAKLVKHKLGICFMNEKTIYSDCVHSYTPLYTIQTVPPGGYPIYKTFM